MSPIYLRGHQEATAGTCKIHVGFLLNSVWEEDFHSDEESSAWPALERKGRMQGLILFQVLFAGVRRGDGKRFKRKGESSIIY